jgi:ribosomal protein S18 acetylase RimI-like enzyme
MSSSMVTEIRGTQIPAPRVATWSDVPAVSGVLAASFFDDPVLTWCYPDGARRREILPQFFELVVSANLGHGQIYTTDGVVAGAVWLPPNADDDEQLVVALGEVSGEYVGRLFHAFELMAEQHPHEPHHYLFLLGTSPEWQGRGVGSAVMRPVLDMCDRDVTPAYLEATSERNRALYARHGFEVMGEIRLPDGPSMWPMWRGPT